MRHDPLHVGDICVIVRSRHPDNIGRIVRVVEIDAGMAPTTVKIAAINPGTLPATMLLGEVKHCAVAAAWAEPWRLRKIIGKGERCAVNERMAVAARDCG